MAIYDPTEDLDKRLKDVREKESATGVDDRQRDEVWRERFHQVEVIQAEQIMHLEQRQEQALRELETRLRAEFALERLKLQGPSLTEWVGSALLAIPTTAVKGVAGLAHEKYMQHYGLKELRNRREGELKLATFLTAHVERVGRCVLTWHRNFLRGLSFEANTAVAEAATAEEYAKAKTKLANEAWDQLDAIVDVCREAVNQLTAVLPAEMRPTEDEMVMETPEDVVAGLKGLCAACRFYLIRNKKKLESVEAVDAMLVKISQDFNDSQLATARLHVELEKKEARHKGEITAIHASLAHTKFNDSVNAAEGVSQDLLDEIRCRLEEILHDSQPLSPIEKIPVWDIKMASPPNAF